jgi:hypothetical protein
MRSPQKYILFSSLAIVCLGFVLWWIGILSTPRDFSSPATTIRLVDQNGAPVRGVEVNRQWYDSDCSRHGGETQTTGQTGVVYFPKIPAKVGLLTGVPRKLLGMLMICGGGNGTSTTVFVRYHDRWDVTPRGKQLHPEGNSQRDSDGVWFYGGLDSQSNSTAHLTFPSNAKVVDYTLSSKITTN